MRLLDLILQDKSFRVQNNCNNFVTKDGTTVKYGNLDTSTEKLRTNDFIGQNLVGLNF